ncbi:peptide ABC transporter substrate-binding protein [Enterococcus timonensis]|uniref:peptide ABC transporter substrate-binding protein n=1 Tax=Enterococcus timonensis TaxID=1852364 RepID=UPI0008D943BE|nr:peptide ABC transporter substrate-binding protein [Enterococcus timonensis]
MRTRNKVFATAGVLLVSTLVLAACGSNNDEGSKDSTGSSEVSTEDLQSSYSYVYSTDPTTFDYTFSSRTTNSTHYANFVEGLLENDQYGNLVGAGAESWEVSEDGLTYTYKLREGNKWVDSQGNEYADVTANDYVAGLKHAADAQSETLYLVAGSVVGLADYADGTNSDFSQVGVKAVDDYTVEYTLNAPEPFWNSKTTYGILFPVNEEFLNEQGENFGAPVADSILYNGPFLLTNFTAKSVIEYTRNEAYWDNENVFLDDIKYTFYDGSDPSSLFKGFDDGTYGMARVFPNDAGFADVEAKYGDDIIWSQTGGTTYNMTFNLNRATYNATTKDEAQQEDTRTAILNKQFRQALQFALDKTTYNSQNVGAEGAEKSLRNTFVPGEFVTIDGKNYGDTVETELAALDPVWEGVDLADGQDGYYDQDKAKEVFAVAKEALSAENVEFPIHLDLPMVETSEINVNQAKSLKKSIEDTLGTDNVVVDIQLLSEDAFNAATYDATTGSASDFDISTASGWGPDYTDPSTYLNIYNAETGDMLQTLGLDATVNVQGEDAGAVAKEAVGFATYDQLLDDAAAITDDLDARYTAYAKAEAWLLDAVIQVPIRADGGTPSLSRQIPFIKSYGWAGISDLKFKNVKIGQDPITTAEYEDALATWEKEKEESTKVE